jgi:hypothetical protein
MHLTALISSVPKWSRLIGTGGRDPSEWVVTIAGMRRRGLETFAVKQKKGQETKKGLAFVAAIRERENGSAGGRTKELFQGGQHTVRSDTLISSLTSQRSRASPGGF